MPTLFERFFFGQTPPLWAGLLYSFALIAVIYIPMVSMIAMIGIWAERKVAAHMQARIGPNRVGPIGILQSIADGVKLLGKEDLRPSAADSILFRLAPYLAFVPVFMAYMAIPFGADMVFEPMLGLGLLWILAILSVEVMGVILAGWSSNNKWSIYGAMREACQMISYEVPMGLSILVAVVAAGTLDLVQLGHLQQGGLHTWLIFRNPFVFIAFFSYFVASLAANKRAPFDLPESESELVAGYHTEYSGLRFSFFFFAEYAGMFVIASIQVLLFLGAWNDPFGLLGHFDALYRAEGRVWGLVVINLIGATLFVAKVSILVFVQMWFRWTLPRPRIDQVLYFCMKVLLPLTCVLLLGEVLWELFLPGPSGAPWIAYRPWVITGWAGHEPALVVQGVMTLVGLGLFLWVVAFIARSAWEGRRVVKRLTDPSPIRAPIGGGKRL
jgi:NADH-quinone oxidoreductase subunit H